MAYQGSGPFTLAPDAVLDLYVMPEEAIDFTQVLSVTFYLVPNQADTVQDGQSGLLLGLFLRSYYERRAQMTRLEPVQWGENPFLRFEGYVDRLGGMHILLTNKSSQPVKVQELGVQVTVLRPDGTTAVVGFTP